MVFTDNGHPQSAKEQLIPQVMNSKAVEGSVTMARRGKLVQIDHGGNRTRCANYYRCLYPAPG
jgi:hypothetical protein